MTLGTFAAQAILETDEPIGRLRGRWRDARGVRVMPTFHPAFLLRSPERKKDVWEDMKLVRDFLAGRMKRAARRPPDEFRTSTVGYGAAIFSSVEKIGKWLAAPMKKSIGIESQAFVRDARKARRAHFGLIGRRRRRRSRRSPWSRR